MNLRGLKGIEVGMEHELVWGIGDGDGEDQ